MEKPTKLPSGKWRIRVLLGRDPDGKPIYKSITRETAQQCTEDATGYLYAVQQGLIEPPGRPKTADLPRVCDVVDKYIDLCKILSPTTVKGYDKIRRTGFPHLMPVYVRDLSDIVMQQAINTEAERIGRRGRISPKTVANEYALISTALNRIAGLKFNIRLPQRQRNYKDYPEPSAVLSAIVGSEIELPCMLAIWCGLRMSEIRGLQWRDINGIYLSIRRVLVDVGTVPTLKDNAKTAASKRRVPIPPYIRALLDATPHENEFVVQGNHDYIYYHFRQIMDAHGLDITFHDLRHYYASIGVLLGIPDYYIQRGGGWSSDTVLKSHYFETFDSGHQNATTTRTQYMDELVQNARKTTSCVPKKTQQKDTEPKFVDFSDFYRGSIPLGSTNLRHGRKPRKG